MEELAVRIIETMPASVRRLTQDLTLEQARMRPAQGEWSVVELAGHLIDKTEEWGARFRRIAAEDAPHLAAFDPDARVVERGYQQQELPALEQRLAAVLTTVAQELRALPAVAWERVGLHAERGRLTLADGVRLYAFSLSEHIQQLVATRDAALARAAGEE